MHFLVANQFVEQVRRLLLRFVERVLQLMRSLQLRDHLGVMGLPVREDRLAQFVLLFHLGPPFRRVPAVGPHPSSSLGRCS